MLSTRTHKKSVEVVLALVVVFAGIGVGGAYERCVYAQDSVPAGIDFIGSETPGLDTIYLRGIDSTDPAGLLRIEVWANQVTDLYGVSFALQFPQSLFRFPKGRASVSVEGPFLSQDGSESTVMVAKQSGNEIIVGHTRTGESPGVSGSGLLMALEFRGLGVAGKRRFRLRRRSAFDASGKVAENYSWLAGKAIVTVSAPPT